MAKSPRRPDTRRPPSAAPSGPHESIQAKTAALTRLMTKAGAAAGPVLINSGIARNVGQLYNSPFGWWGQAYQIEAPPPGQVLWFTLAFNWQIYHWNAAGPANNSDRELRVNFGASWRWELVPHPQLFPEPLPRFMADSDRYEFYSSVAPGGSGFDVAWIVPARSATLTPDSKESDPTPLELLLRSQLNGQIRLWLRGQTSDLIVNGQDPHFAFAIGGVPDGLYWSYAVALSRIPDVGPAIGNAGVARR
jgi:hypothetical protein